MNEPSHYKTPETEEEIDAFVMKYRDAATNVLRCGTGQAGIVRYLEHVEGFSSEDSNRLSYPLFDKAKKKLRRTQWPKLIIAIFLLIIGIVGPVTLFLLEFDFVILSSLPIIAGWALLKTIILPEALEG